MSTCTPEFIASIRHDYENTAKSIERIAADHGINERSINRMCVRLGWPRRSDRSRELPAPLQLLRRSAAVLAAQPTATAEGADRLRAMIRRVIRLVECEVAGQEYVRARMGTAERQPHDAERCARTLSALTETLAALQRLDGGTFPDVAAHDDIPAGAEEFLRDLGRRLEEFEPSPPPEVEPGLSGASRA